MPNEDKRRRLSGETTTQLSVAELIARREAETQPIPRITDEVAADPTVRFEPVTVHTRVPAQKNQGQKNPAQKKTSKSGQGRELHITELLKREGRGNDTDGGGFAMGKLVAAASGGVVLCGSVAFGASQWLSSPDERPLAEVRFDERAQARGASDSSKGVVKLPAPQTQAQTDATGTESAETTEAAKPRVAPNTQQQQPQTQAPTTEQQTQTQAPAPTTPPAETTTPPPAETTTPPPTSSTTPPPAETTTPPASTTPSTGIEIDLGILDPVLGGFDFFAPAN